MGTISPADRAVKPKIRPKIRPARTPSSFLLRIAHSASTQQRRTSVRLCESTRSEALLSYACGFKTSLPASRLPGVPAGVSSLRTPMSIRLATLPVDRPCTLHPSRFPLRLPPHALRSSYAFSLEFISHSGTLRLFRTDVSLFHPISTTPSFVIRSKVSFRCPAWCSE